VCSLQEPLNDSIDPHFQPELAEMMNDEARDQLDELELPYDTADQGEDEELGSRAGDDDIALPDSSQRFIMQTFLE